MWNAALYAAMFVAVVVTTGVQGRGLWRDRSIPGVRSWRARVAVWLLVVSACLVVANTLTTLGGAWPSLAHVNGRGINLVPFRGVGPYLSELEVGHGNAWRNIVGNAVLFVPLGASLGLHPDVSIRRGLGGMVLAGTGIEVVQLTLGRSSDVDDLLLNVLGGLLAMTVTVTFVRAIQRYRAARIRRQHPGDRPSSANAVGHGNGVGPDVL